MTPREAQALETERRLTLIANEFGRVRNELAKRHVIGNSTCAARRALYSLRRGDLDRVLGYCETAVGRDPEWAGFADLARGEVERQRGQARTALAAMSEG